jgi:hypothetical protein
MQRLCIGGVPLAYFSSTFATILHFFKLWSGSQFSPPVSRAPHQEIVIPCDARTPVAGIIVISIPLPIGCVPLLPATLRSTVAPSVQYLVALTLLPPRPAVARGHVPTLICILSATRPADGRRTAFGDCLLIESLALGRTLARARRMSELFLVRCRARIGALGFGRLRLRRASRLRRRGRIPSAARLRPIGSTAFEAIGVIGRASLLIARACATHRYIIRGGLRGGDGRSALTNRGSIARRRVRRRGRPGGCVERRLRLRSTRAQARGWGFRRIGAIWFGCRIRQRSCWVSRVCARPSNPDILTRETLELRWPDECDEQSVAVFDFELMYTSLEGAIRGVRPGCSLVPMRSVLKPSALLAISGSVARGRPERNAAIGSSHASASYLAACSGVTCSRSNR